MQIEVKIILSVAIILLATAIGKNLPSTAGLVGVMLLTGALVLVWMFLENKGDPEIMQDFAKGPCGEFWPASFSFLWLSPALRNTFLCPLSLRQASGSGWVQLLSINGC